MKSYSVWIKCHIAYQSDPFFTSRSVFSAILQILYILICSDLRFAISLVPSDCQFMPKILLIFDQLLYRRLQAHGMSQEERGSLMEYLTQEPEEVQAPKPQDRTSSRREESITVSYAHFCLRRKVCSTINILGAKITNCQLCRAEQFLTGPKKFGSANQLTFPTRGTKLPE